MVAIVAGVAVMAAEEAEDTTTVEVNIYLQFQFYPAITAYYFLYLPKVINDVGSKWQLSNQQGSR